MRAHGGVGWWLSSQTQNILGNREDDGTFILHTDVIWFHFFHTLFVFSHHPKYVFTYTFRCISFPFEGIFRFYLAIRIKPQRYQRLQIPRSWDRHRRQPGLPSSILEPPNLSVCVPLLPSHTRVSSHTIQTDTIHYRHSRRSNRRTWRHSICSLFHVLVESCLHPSDRLSPRLQDLGPSDLVEYLHFLQSRCLLYLSRMVSLPCSLLAIPSWKMGWRDDLKGWFSIIIQN